MFTYSNRLQPALQNLLQHVVRFFHPRSSYIGGCSENNIKFVMHDDLRWKNQTTQYIMPCHWLHEWFSQFHSCGTYSVLSRNPSFICQMTGCQEGQTPVEAAPPPKKNHHAPTNQTKPVFNTVLLEVAQLILSCLAK